ncbi:metalloregulator ArsR/SmtB family transcription factor [Actinotalea sp. K2]|uniref:helix-turn-helix transcriptional regulator n=1 Tax=Actinotalea sp. K2 TaxID=2939438 RepID=UPI0020173998|nr:helix-turn-helix domain-containing protein [Actinotalea sp. K2]MCL3861964.1 helix-turn-helix domain-containing protein [Actinotalea sp. K2]
MLTAVPAPLAADPAAVESTTRQRILRLVVEVGPVSVVELARDLDLTAAGVRRHVAALEDSGQVAVHDVPLPGHPRRGRPARRYVATDKGQTALSSAYSDLATQALRFLAQVGGDEAVEAFAVRRVQDLELRHADTVAAAGSDVGARAEALAAALAGDGYASSARPMPGGRAVQLCQGHCPVRDVAAEFPQLCEAEARLFSRLLGVHVQRLSTLASGGHVCTTHVPTTSPSVRAASDRPAPAATVEGTR